LLSLQLNLLRARQDLTKAHSTLQRAQSSLNSFLSLDKATMVNCIVPEKIPDMQVRADEAVGKATENNPNMLSHLQELLEQDESVAKAKAKAGFSTSIYALYGLNQTADKFSDVYNDPVKSQVFQVGISVPILDWGKRRGSYLMAKSNREVAEARIKQERIEFEQQVYQDVIEFNLQAEQVYNAAMADTVAQKGYNVTLQRFLIGKVDVVKLNIARSDLETARSRYVEELRDYWNYYYRIRMWTLFDFVKDQTLSAEFDKILQK
jgi:outer membrane protein TolC